MAFTAHRNHAANQRKTPPRLEKAATSVSANRNQ
jgi:hypothetical protein